MLSTRPSTLISLKWWGYKKIKCEQNFAFANRNSIILTIYVSMHVSYNFSLKKQWNFSLKNAFRNILLCGFANFCNILYKIFIVCFWTVNYSYYNNTNMFLYSSKKFKLKWKIYLKIMKSQTNIFVAQKIHLWSK